VIRAITRAFGPFARVIGSIAAACGAFAAATGAVTAANGASAGPDPIANAQSLTPGAYDPMPAARNAVARALASLLLTPKPACSPGAPVFGQVRTSIIDGSAPTAA